MQKSVCRFLRAGIGAQQRLVGEGRHAGGGAVFQLALGEGQ